MSDNAQSHSYISYPKTAKEIEEEKMEKEKLKYEEEMKVYQQKYAEYQQMMLLAQAIPIQAQINQYAQQLHIANNQQQSVFQSSFSTGKSEPNTLAFRNPKKERIKNQQRTKGKSVAVCISCSADFENMKDYAHHMNGHTKCTKCEYVAHFTLVQIHEVKAHGTSSKSGGMSNYHVPKLETPEEIAAWIAERKKRYPTKNNCANKTSPEGAKRKPTEDGEIEEGELEAHPVIKKKKDNKPCRFYAKGDCRKGENCPFLHSDDIVFPKALVNSTATKNTPVPTSETPYNEQERNILLKVISHFVQKDFKGGPATPS